VDLAVTKERFASIAGWPRQGDFRDASVVLPDWKDCSLYGKVKMENKQCSICLRHFTEFGNKAWPINDGRCCNVCNDCLRPHLRARIAQSPAPRTTDRRSSTNPDRDPLQHAASVVRPAPAAAARMRPFVDLGRRGHAQRPQRAPSTHLDRTTVEARLGRSSSEEGREVIGLGR
jgi:hypothetical protein